MCENLIIINQKETQKQVFDITLSRLQFLGDQSSKTINSIMEHHKQIDESQMRVAATLEQILELQSYFTGKKLSFVVKEI